MLRPFKRLLRGKARPTIERLMSQGFDRQTSETIQRVLPFTMTSPTRIAALCDAVQYVVKHRIPGSIVECGVWRGGSMMAVAETLQHLRSCSRDLYLFDTYSGMTPPGENDLNHSGTDAKRLLDEADRNRAESVWCVAGLTEVVKNLAQTAYPSEKMHFISGRVENTLPGSAPERISILRLDTDWYESTRHELEHLFPRLSPGGVLILDDYGYWQGARRAVDEYFDAHPTPILLTRIDFTGRMGIYHPISTSSITRVEKDFNEVA